MPGKYLSEVNKRVGLSSVDSAMPFQLSKLVEYSINKVTNHAVLETWYLMLSVRCLFKRCWLHDSSFQFLLTEHGVWKFSVPLGSNFLTLPNRRQEHLLCWTTLRFRLKTLAGYCTEPRRATYKARTLRATATTFATKQLEQPGVKVLVLHGARRFLSSLHHSVHLMALCHPLGVAPPQ